jgi:hypothetical protein
VGRAWANWKPRRLRLVSSIWRDVECCAFSMDHEPDVGKILIDGLPLLVAQLLTLNSYGPTDKL